MVSIRPKVVEAIEGCKSFGFQTNNRVQEHRRLNMQGMTAQAAVVARVKAMLEAFQNLPCEIRLQVGAKQGRTIMTGEILPYDASSEQKAESILHEVDQMVFAFSRNYQESEFLVNYFQSVTVTRVDWHKNR